MENCREVAACRVCGGPLSEVLNLGEQCLAGQFPAKGEPDPPRFPLVLTRCASGCGLVQLGHTVAPGLMFNEGYGYRSSVTSTMRRHLQVLAQEAAEVLGRWPQKVLDIGCNDWTLLSLMPEKVGEWSVRLGVDPFDPVPGRLYNHVKALWPCKLPLPDTRFDLIFSIACFYDADDPVKFARAVKDNLAPGGLWCVEVANLNTLLGGSWDQVCHEHLCYYDMETLTKTLAAAGLGVTKASMNTCNGGSLRVYATANMDGKQAPKFRQPDWVAFAGRVQRSAVELRDYLLLCRSLGLKAHLLGASTKANTVLQYVGATPGLIEAASDRDPRKAGRRTPGTNIPIISEEESRTRRPDVYLSVLNHFREEIVAREQEFLKLGGCLAFALPGLSYVLDEKFVR